MLYACDSLVMCYYLHGVFLGLTVVSNLPCHFLDSHGVVGFPLGQVPYGCGLEQMIWKPWNRSG